LDFGKEEEQETLRQILEQRRITMNRNTISTFIYLEKAFDKMDWRILFKILREK